jgi:hypothetical protein
LKNDNSDLIRRSDKYEGMIDRLRTVSDHQMEELVNSGNHIKDLENEI